MFFAIFIKVSNNMYCVLWCVKTVLVQYNGRIIAYFNNCGWFVFSFILVCLCTSCNIMQECGGIRGRGIVVQVLDKAIDVLVQDYGVIKRVYCEV